MIKAIIFDWGNTVMRDFPEKSGPMAYWDHVEYIPDVEACLKTLSEKYVMCIASNAGFSDAKLMTEALKRVGAEKYFHHFFTSKDLGAEKPDKRFFDSITKKINISSEHCIMIGDSYQKDICGAKAVGMKTILFNEKNINADFPDADKVIVSMRELINAIEGI
ncbi:MAG TPA: HAD family hydrolase [Bacteroidales bacterium]|nr:HAD family hydrolase [Bacteroidales bacterium]HPS17505.1 HAD family hydrolase [Bacteroidales bacterium]